MKRGQAAMEFLMSYGWAILVVLAAIGALAYMGVLNPLDYMGDSCILTTGIACNGFKVTQGSYAIVITNSMGKDVYIRNATIGSCTSMQMNQSFKANEQATIVSSGCSFPTEGDPISTDITVEYTEKMTNIDKKNIGTIKAKIAPGGDIIISGTGSGGSVPVTLSPAYAESYQDEGTTGDDVTSLVSSLDDVWGPRMTGSVSRPYYATGTSPAFFDALSLRFATSSFNATEYDAKLRFYIRDGEYSTGWHHYKVYDEFTTDDCEDEPGGCAGSSSYIEGFEGWIEKSISDDFWDDGEMSIRFWDTYVDKVELVLTPTG